MNTDRQRERFELLQARAQATVVQTSEMRRTLQCRYQSPRYAPLPKRRKLETLERTEKRHCDRLFTFVQSISPRDWSQGVPYRWLIESLTFTDATTHDTLAVVPPPAWGYTEHDTRIFAGPVVERRIS